MGRGKASWEMRNEDRMGGIMSEHNRPFEPSNDQPELPQPRQQPDPPRSPSTGWTPTTASPVPAPAAIAAAGPPPGPPRTAAHGHLLLSAAAAHPRLLAPQRPARRRLRPPGRPVQVHPLPVEAALRG